MIPKALIAELVNKHALVNQIRPDVVTCIIIQESKGDTFSWRWEEAFYEKFLKPKTRSELSGWLPAPAGLPSLVDEKLQRSCSFGLMQVLGDTARWCGKVTTPYLTALCDPDQGIACGCKVLSYYLGKANGDYRHALKYYNGAWSYADEVLGRVKNGEHLEYFQAD